MSLQNKNLLQVNYKAVKESLKLSGKQLSNLLYGLHKLNIINVSVTPSRQVLVDDTPGLQIFKNHLIFVEPGNKKGIPENDLGDLMRLLPESSDSNLADIPKTDYYEVVKAMKQKYPIHKNNRYFQHFTAGHKQQFLRTFAARLEKDKITSSALESMFSHFLNHENWSLADILYGLTLTCPKYTVFDALLDFIWIQTEGKVATASMEAKGAKTLKEWVEKEITTITEIEDCWLFMLSADINYNLSLISLAKALQQFQKFRTTLSDGRFSYRKPVDSGKQSAYNKALSNIESI